MTITINGREVKVKEVTFEGICELEENYGFDIKKVDGAVFSTIRKAYAFHAGISLKEAAKDIEQHVSKGGTLDSFNPFLDAIIDSPFMEALRATVTDEEEQ